MGNPIVENLLRKGYRHLNVKPSWPLEKMVKKTIDHVCRHVMRCRELRRLLEDLANGHSDIVPANSPPEELHRYIAVRHGKIDKGNPAVTLEFLRNFVAEAAVLERQAIAHGAGLITDITPDERVMLTDLATPLATDKLWFRWFEKAVIPLETLPEEEKGQRKEALAKILPEYDYTVTKNRRRTPWAKAFLPEIFAVKTALQELHDRIKDKNIQKYLRRLIFAYGCTEIDDLEKRWADVDLAWIAIPKTCRVFPVHGMESGYEHPHGVSPEWRVMVRLDFGREEVADICRQSPIVSGRLGADQSVITEKMGKIDVDVFYTAIWAGMNLNFRMAGQAVPNRQDVLIEGGKIFMDLDSLSLAVDNYRGILKKHLLSNQADRLAKLITTKSMMEHTAGHEVTHPAGRSQEIDKELGTSLKLLEEAKATMGGLLINEARIPKKRLAIVAETVARICRFMHRTTMGNPTSRQYVWENMVAASTLHRAGIIRVSRGKIRIDLKRAQTRDWFEELERFMTGIFAAYRNNDQTKLQTMKDDLCNEKEGIIAELIALVNKE